MCANQRVKNVRSKRWIKAEYTVLGRATLDKLNYLHASKFYKRLSTKSRLLPKLA